MNGTSSDIFELAKAISLVQVASYRPLTEGEGQLLNIPDGPFDEEADDPDSAYCDRRNGERSQWPGIPAKEKS